VTADYCADDFVLGNETFKLGQTVVLSHHAIDHMVINPPWWLPEASDTLDEVDTVFAARGALLGRRSVSACHSGCWGARLRL